MAGASPAKVDRCWGHADSTLGRVNAERWTTVHSLTCVDPTCPVSGCPTGSAALAGITITRSCDNDGSRGAPAAGVGAGRVSASGAVSCENATYHRKPGEGSSVRFPPAHSAIDPIAADRLHRHAVVIDHQPRHRAVDRHRPTSPGQPDRRCPGPHHRTTHTTFLIMVCEVYRSTSTGCGQLPRRVVP
jgi:hypothetical protein